jgi:hypothetical protein
MFDYIYGQAKQLIESVREETRDLGLLPLLEPVAPFNRSRLLLPLVIAGSLLSLVFLSGIAIGACAALFTALVGLYLLLSEVFGVSLELTVPAR